MNNENLNFLLVYTHLRTGGIETLIVRMANWLVSKGNSVTLFLFYPGELLSLLDERIEIIIYPFGNAFFIPFFSKKYLIKKINYRTDMIYSYGPEGCYIASFIYKYSLFLNKPIFLNGIYHPYEFALGGGVSVTDRMRIDLYNEYIDDRSKLFMSEEVRSGNEIILGRKICQSTIWPLPIEDSKYRGISREYVPRKIVSIGRFANFKAYNIYMIDVVKDLIDMGYSNTIWEVYGSGPLENNMKEKIKENNLEERVILKGVLPYGEIAEILSSAHVFVGMGTALIEAGFCKVPCVPAIVNDENGFTYGSLYTLPYYCCGERLSENYSTVSVTNAICRIFEMNEREYILESEKTYEYVQVYSIDPLMHKFIQYIENINEGNCIYLYPCWKYIIYYFSSIFQNIRKYLCLRSRVNKIIGKLYKIKQLKL